MVAQKGQDLLLGCLTLQKRSDGPQMVGPVTKGKVAGPLNVGGGIAAGQIEDAHEHSCTLNAAGFDHRLGPSGALRADPDRDLLEKPRCAALDSANLLGSDVLRRSAKSTRFALAVQRNLLHPAVEDPDDPSVPSHPDFAPAVFRRDRVVRPFDLDMAVGVNCAPLL